MIDFDCYDYGKRFYDPQLGRFIGIDPIAESFYYVTPYNYAENDPVGAIDLWGLQKLKIAGNFKLTTGQIGFETKILGVPIGLNFSRGGAEQEISLYAEIDIRTGKIKMGASHTQTQIKESKSVSIGIHASESEEKETVTDINTLDGFSMDIGKKYEKKESGGIGYVTIEEDKNGKTAKSDFGTEVKANAGILGFGAGLEIEYDPDKQGESEVIEEKELIETYSKNSYVPD